MKHLLTLLLLVCCLPTQATVRIVTCQNGAYHFLPVTVNAYVGDTIHWTWVSGNHIVGPILETDIPALADTWFGVIDATYNTFEYVVEHPGTYHYVCHPSAPHGEDGYINVALNTTVPEARTAEVDARLFPNPFTDQLTLDAPGATDLILYDLTGARVRSFSVSNGRAHLRTDLGSLPQGVYIVSIMRDGVVVATKRMVKQ